MVEDEKEKEEQEQEDQSKWERSKSMSKRVEEVRKEGDEKTDPPSGSDRAEGVPGDSTLCGIINKPHCKKKTC